MKTVDINDALNKILVGKKLSKQDGVPQHLWGFTIKNVKPFRDLWIVTTDYGDKDFCSFLSKGSIKYL